MNKFLCSLACSWMTIIDNQFILLTAYLQMFYWNEMLTWWLPGCKLDCTFLQVKIHPSSVNFQVGYFESPYLVYHEKVKTTRVSCDTDILQCSKHPLNNFLTSGDFCRLLTAFANSLDPDQD